MSYVGVCEKCGKRCYKSRSAARKARKRMRGHTAPGLAAYQCGAYWHLGHLAPAVREGRVTRRIYAPKKEAS